MSHVSSVLIGVLGSMLILVSSITKAQEKVPPPPESIATPTPAADPTIPGDVTDPAPTPLPAEDAEPAGHGTPVPEPAEADLPEEAASNENADPADEAGAPDAPTEVEQERPLNEIPEEPKEQFDLNAYPETAKKKPKEKWDTFKDGVRGLLVWDFFDSRLTIRGHARVQVDGTLAYADNTMESFYGELDSGFDARRLEAFAQGTIDHHLRYSVSFNFGADAGFGDIFVEGREQGLNVFGYRVGQFRLGSFQEPFSFERTMSSYYTGFLERSLPVWTFAPGSNIGYMVFDTSKNKRFTWAAGFFSWGQNDENNASNSVLSVTSRLTWLPVYRDGGKKLLHIGGSFSTRDPNGDTQYRSRPEARFVSFLVDTGHFRASRIKLYGVELVGVRGPLSLQSELIASDVSGTDFGSARFWGGYVQVGWFLTGEHKSYDTGMGVFSRVAPKQDLRGVFRRKPGGGLELMGRISNVDLDDGEISGGKMIDYSVGLNWYLSSTSAVKFNWVHSRVEDRGSANILSLRYQFRPLPVPGWR